MAFTHAGLYGTDSITNSSGRPLAAGTPVAIYEAGTVTLATLYTDRTKTVTVPNPTVLAAAGNLSFWAEPGLYSIAIGGGSFLADVGVDADDVAAIASGGISEADVTALLAAHEADTTNVHGYADITAIGSGGRASFEHPVMVPDDDYIVTHNKGVDPAVVGFIQAGVAYGIYWEIVTPGVSIRITHGSPMTGKAVLVF